MHLALGRLLIVTGLPGAGKSWLIDNQLRQTVTGLCVHDFHGDAFDHSPEVEKSRHYTALLAALRAGHHCVISDIEFCRPSRRDALVKVLRTSFPSLSIEYHCFRNQPDRCLRNVIARGRNSKDDECRKIVQLSKEYVMPVGAIEHDVVENPRTSAD